MGAAQSGTQMRVLGGSQTVPTMALRLSRSLGVFVVLLSVFSELPTVPAAPMDDRVAAARAEGKVMIYNGWLGETEKLVSGFKAKYPGIAAEYTEIGGWLAYERYMSEERARVRVADVIFNTLDVITQLHQDAAVTPYVSGEAAYLPGKYKRSDGAWTNVKALFMFPTVNANLVPPSLWPKDWSDFANPKPEWNGKVTLYDPRASSAAYAVLYALDENLGPERTRAIYRGLRALNARTYPTTVGGIQAALTGEAPMMFYIVVNHWALYRSKGANFPMIVPASGVIPLMGSAALTKNPPHPNAARLFIDYMLSKDGQDFFASIGQYPLRLGSKAPTDAPRLNVLRMLNYDVAASLKRKDEVVKLWSDAMGF